MRPLHELVINSGALVLGIWSIRAILAPGTSYRTLIDLALSVVILFLLGAITFRALQYRYEAGEVYPFRWTATASAPKRPGNECDYRGCDNPIVTRCATWRQAFCPRHVDSGPPPLCDACSQAHAGPPAPADRGQPV
jgi:hypothetical protein